MKTIFLFLGTLLIFSCNHSLCNDEETKQKLISNITDQVRQAMLSHPRSFPLFRKKVDDMLDMQFPIKLMMDSDAYYQANQKNMDSLQEKEYKSWAHNFFTERRNLETKLMVQEAKAFPIHVKVEDIKIEQVENLGNHTCFCSALKTDIIDSMSTIYYSVDQDKQGAISVNILQELPHK